MNECLTCISNLMRDALSRFDLLARKARRRRSYKAGERDGERALRAVADTLRDLADADLAPPEQVLRQGHAPGEQVLHGRDADRPTEALEEGRAGETGFLRQLGNRPGCGRAFMHLAK